ncbi:hypothetical protein KKG58_01635 [Patescibacteria group bacterium]|nr:hypothetical protein [Patescibacteria group bacterium]
MSRRIFAKYPIPTQKDIEKNLGEDAKFVGMTVEKYLDFVIKGVIGDIMKSTEIIARENQRIKKAKKTFNVILSMITKYESKESKKKLKQHYNDLLKSRILGINSRIKN